MIKNLWNSISFYCMNGHEEPVPLTVQYGDSPFYACPRYFLVDNEHPDGHLPGERACANRISFRDAEGIVSEFSKQMEEDIDDDCIADYTGYTFAYHHIKAKIIEYSFDSIKIGVVNRLAVAR